MLAGEPSKSQCNLLNHCDVLLIEIIYLILRFQFINIKIYQQMKEIPSIDCFFIFGFKHFIDNVKHAKRADMTC